MNLIRWGNGLTRPFLEFETLQEEINRLFNDAAHIAEPQGLFEGRILTRRGCPGEP